MTTSGTVRTRFAPSPTGFMHVGNLRTALYEYLIAKAAGGSFVLRIEDTDQGRLVEGAVDIIYKTLREVGMNHDEGPDIGGPYAPYVQSERLSMYRPFAEELVEKGHAYYCFCTKERLDSLKEQAGEGSFTGGYDRHCRHLTQTEIDEKLAAGLPYVIRQKMPLDGATTFEDAVYGSITVENSELEDQVLLKSDGYPTYNFANVVDDHAMGITHVVRGSEYLSSTPKYNLLYQAFGWEVPTYVHLPLINGMDGKKLSKRHGSTSFEGLIAEGYLPEAIINYIAMLGWCPVNDNREIFTLTELEQVFSIEGISKSPAVFDYDKLTWFNAEYIRAMSREDFIALIKPQLEQIFGQIPQELELLADILQPRVTKLVQLPDMIGFLAARQDYELDLFSNKKSKSSPELAADVLPQALDALKSLTSWDRDSIHDCLIGLAQKLEMKNGQVMWPVRIAASGQAVTPGGAIEVLVILGRDEAIARLEDGIARLNK
ncbi:MAG: glutamate--tRNA ligase [Clostridiaceae bacterium]|nr:glutamate--tRNA ligase [Clostridiaceae bacterium]